MLGLTALYTLAPSRNVPRWRWLSWGGAAATVVWIGTSAAFSAYAASFSSFNRFYGSLGGVAIFLVWLYLSGLIIILGAEIDAELDAQRSGPRESGVKRGLQQREKKLEPANNG